MSHENLARLPYEYTDFSTTDIPPSSSIPWFDFDYKIYKVDSANNKGSELNGILTSDYDDSYPYGDYSTWENDSTLGGEAKYAIDILLNAQGDPDFSTTSSSYLETLSTLIDFGGAESIFDFSNAYLIDVGSDFNYANTANFDKVNNTVEFTGAVGDEIANTTGLSLDGSGETKLFTITQVKVSDVFETGVLDYDPSSNETFRTKLIDNIDAEIDIYDTVVSNRTVNNANIKSVHEIATEIGVDPDWYIDYDVTGNVHAIEAKVDLVNYATSVYTQRFIGSNDKTSLIREGATAKGSAYWSNLGSYKVNSDELIIEDYGSGEGNGGVRIIASNVAYDTDFEGLDISQYGLSETGSLSTVDTFQIELDYLVTGKAGDRIDDSMYSYKVYSQNGDAFSASSDSVITNNLITFKGDLNYDGRVSLKDLAFLNAGKLAEEDNDLFSDVDANYDDTIDTKDLAVLSQDFGKTLHSSFTPDDIFSATTWSYADKDLTTISEHIEESYLYGSYDLNDVNYSNSSFNYQATVDPLVQVNLGTLGDIKGQLYADSGLDLGLS